MDLGQGRRGPAVGGDRKRQSLVLFDEYRRGRLNLGNVQRWQRGRGTATLSDDVHLLAFHQAAIRRVDEPADRRIRKEELPV